MAVVPDDEIGTVQQEPLPGRAIPHFDTSVDNSGTEKLGSSLEQAGNIMAAVEQKKQREADQVRIAQANTDLNTWTVDRLYNGTKEQNGQDAAYRQQGENAVNMPGRYLPQFDQRAQDISATLTPRQQAAFAERVASERNEFNLQLNRHEYEQGNREAVSTFNQAKAATIKSAALGYRDAEATTKARNDLLMANEALGARVGMSKADKLTAYGNDLDALHSSTVGAFLADGNIGGAQQYLDKWKDDLSSGVKHEELQNHITAAADKAQGQFKDTARSAYQDATKAGLAGIPGAGRLVSDDQLQVLYKDDWQRHRDFLDKAAATGAVEKKYDSMAPADIQVDLDRSKPTQAVPGVGDDVELWNMRNAAAERSMARRVSDPRQFQIKSAGQDPIDFSKPVDQTATTLNQRFNAMGEDGQRLGVAVPPLSKGEARQFGSALDQSTSGQQVALLTQYRNALGDTRFKALMEQIRPTSPVTAKAALLAPRDPSEAPLWYNANFDSDGDTPALILRGQELLNPSKEGKAEEGKGGFKGGMEMPPLDQFRDRWNNLDPVERQLFADRAIEGDTTFEAIRSTYAALASDKGLYSNQISTAMFDEAARRVIGNTDRHFVNAVEVPRGMDPSRFPNYVKASLRAVEQDRGLREGALDGHGLQPIGPYGSGRYGLMDGARRITYPGTPDWIQIDLNQQYARSLRRGVVTRPPPTAATATPTRAAGGSSVGDPRFQDNPNENQAALEAANELGN